MPCLCLWVTTPQAQKKKRNMNIVEAVCAFWKWFLDLPPKRKQDQNPDDN